MSTLNDLISAAISGATEEEASSAINIEETHSHEKLAHTTVPSDDIEKIASALEFVANRGVESFVKEARMFPKGNEAAINFKPETGKQKEKKEMGQYLKNAKKEGAFHMPYGGKGRPPVSKLTKNASEKTKADLIKEALAAKVAESIKEKN